MACCAATPEGPATAVMRFCHVTVAIGPVITSYAIGIGSVNRSTYTLFMTFWVTIRREKEHIADSLSADEVQDLGAFGTIALPGIVWEHPKLLNVFRSDDDLELGVRQE